MNHTFWSHTIWYILLGVTTLLQLAVTVAKAERRGLAIALYLTLSGMSFSFEMFILSYFKAYEYFPKLLPQSPSDDSVAGNLFSQFSVSATALMAALFELKFYWYFILAGLYGLIEEGFLALGIYKHHWYRTWMTVVGLLAFSELRGFRTALPRADCMARCDICSYSSDCWPCISIRSSGCSG